MFNSASEVGMKLRVSQRDCIVSRVLCGVLAMTALFTACGGGGGESSTRSPAMGTAPGSGSGNGNGSGKVALIITGAKSFNPNITPGQIIQYEITVSGEGFDPVKAVVSGDAADATIDGIPTGTHRMVHVAAVNPNQQKIREGEAADVEIPNDAVAEVPITMQAVPVITNVADGAYVSNTRLRFKIFSDPASLVELTSATGETTSVLTDAVENRPTVATDASTGLATFIPPKLAPGDYLLTVRDAKTGRKSQVAVVVTDGGQERAAPLKPIALPARLVMRSE